MSTSDMSSAVRVRELCVEFRTHGGLFGRGGVVVPALRSVSLEIGHGETVALVGESGSGKSTLARAMVGLLAERGAKVTGSVELFVPALSRSIELVRATSAELRAARRSVGFVFQDPFSSLPPRRTVADTLLEVLRASGRAFEVAPADEIGKLLDSVGLERALGASFAHQLSGGQRQRVGLARALAMRPNLFVCDEVLSALDPLVQVELLELLRRVICDARASMLFVTHDLAAARRIGDRIAVMYAGEIVEVGLASDISERAAHPYTRALWAARPSLEFGACEPRGLDGEPPVPSALPGGCAFHPRCPSALPECATLAPPRVALGGGHEAACVLLK